MSSYELLKVGKLSRLSPEGDGTREGWSSDGFEGRGGAASQGIQTTSGLRKKNTQGNGSSLRPLGKNGRLRRHRETHFINL